MFRVLLVSFLLLLPLPVFCQYEALQPREHSGLVVFSNGDTSEVFIKTMDSVDRCQGIEVRKDINGEYEFLSASEVAFYVYESRKYVSKQIKRPFQGTTAVFMEELMREEDGTQLYAYYFISAKEVQGKVLSVRDHCFYLSHNDYLDVQITQSNFKRKMKSIYTDEGFVLEDIKDGVLCFKYMQEGMENLNRKKEYLAISK